MPVKKHSTALFKATRNYRLALKALSWAREFGTEQDLAYCQVVLTRRRVMLKRVRRGL